MGVLPDCRLIYSVGLFGCENNGFTIISPGNNGDERIIGEIGKDCALYYLEKNMLVRRDKEDELTVMLCVKNATSVGVDENLIAISYYYKDTTFSSTVYFDYNGKKQEDTSHKRLLNDIYSQITSLLLDRSKLEKKNFNNETANDTVIMPMIDYRNLSEDAISRVGVNYILELLKRCDLLHKGSALMYRKLEKMIDDLGIDDEFQDIIINIMDYCTTKRYPGRQIGHLITNPVFERIQQLSENHKKDEMKSILSSRACLEKAMEDI